MTRRRWLVLVGSVVGSAMLAVAAPVALAAAGSHGRVVAAARAPREDVTLVLGAGLLPDGSPTPFLAARLDVAAELLRQGRTRLIVVSGSRRPGHDEPASMTRYLVAHGVPRERIVQDPEGHTTLASCVRARQVYGVQRALVVSQGYHLPRAVSLCRAEGIETVGVGDWRMRTAFPQVWTSGALREVGADAKGVLDLALRRKPGADRPDPVVQDALARTP